MPRLKGKIVLVTGVARGIGQAIAELFSGYGKLDILINNAGITGFLETTGPHDPENLDIEGWHKVHRVNLDGVAFGPGRFQ